MFHDEPLALHDLQPLSIRRFLILTIGSITVRHPHTLPKLQTGQASMCVLTRCWYVKIGKRQRLWARKSNSCPTREVAKRNRKWAAHQLFALFFRCINIFPVGPMPTPAGDTRSRSFAPVHPRPSVFFFGWVINNHTLRAVYRPTCDAWLLSCLQYSTYDRGGSRASAGRETAFAVQQMGFLHQLEPTILSFLESGSLDRNSTEQERRAVRVSGVSFRVREVIERD